MYIARSMDDDPMVLTLVVGREPGVRRRPRFRVEAATCRRSFHLQAIRVMVGESPILWALRDEPWDENPTFLRGALPERAGLLPTITQADARACTEKPRSAGWWSHWLRYFADKLGAATDGVLQHGDYALAALARPIDATLEALTTTPSPDTLTRSIECTRRPSPVTDRRVEMWRKRAKEGIPPALFYDWMCFPGPFLMDGHDRLLAMALAGEPLLGLQLTPIAFGGKDRMLTGSTSWGRTFADRRYAVGRLHPLPGGIATWKREVRSRLWAVRDELVERSPAGRLLDGLE